MFINYRLLAMGGTIEGMLLHYMLLNFKKYEHTITLYQLE